MIVESKSRSSILIVCLLILTLWLAFGLRIIYFLESNRIVDEYISMLSIQAILEEGTPILPSGRLYGPKGLLHGYVGAFSAVVFGETSFSLCFQSVVAGSLAIAYLYRAGSEWFNPATGLTAAVALTWMPSAIQWGGRIRMYSMWQLLALTAVHLLVSGYLTKPRQRTRVTGTLAMALSLLAHTLTLIVLGGTAIAIFVGHLVLPANRERNLDLSRWDALALTLLALTVVAINPLRGPWGARVKMSNLAQGALTLQAIREQGVYLLAFTHQFVAGPLWFLSLFYAVGFLNLLLRLARGSTTPGDRQALSIYVLAFCIWFGTSVFAHVHRDRYLMSLVPFFLLLALREICSFASSLFSGIGLSARCWKSALVPAVVSLTVVSLLATSTLQGIRKKDPDLAAAYDYVRKGWKSNDAVAACHPAPSYWFLRQTDYYAIEYPGVVQDGIDVWTGAPLIDTPEEFARSLDEHERTWYVADNTCWERYLGEEYRRLVRQSMNEVYNQKGVRVFLSTR